MEDDKVVAYPIEKVVFKKTLRLNSVGIKFSQSGQLELITLYFNCCPDYFAGQATEVEISPDHSKDEFGF